MNIPSCPSCGQQLKSRPYSWVCSNCGLQINNIISGKVISPAIIQQLCTNKRTPVMSGFISKARKPFSAALVIRDNRIVFEFPNNDSSSRSDDAAMGGAVVRV
ncbi:topoisomerase C-terminal repeat-containing protein [Bacteroides sp.]|uniref:topoisomerase C-terminal repeat-containing protein n=1 Tax=Bacteroides sp. TaxID=29523 RepID=UPI00261BA212|nr:topoisomerase C-terminal repeat-containing protein [Bacteroides sp.]MDD3040398.1 topoisomerase C-terminal repeat-containing protein [Bacteroides sp.]